MSGTVDLAAIVTRLLLFDHYVIDSSRLREFPALINAFGVNGVEALLDSGCVEILCDARTLDRRGNLQFSTTGNDAGSCRLVATHSVSSVFPIARNT